MTTPTVLITGLNSFVAVHTALWFLEHGWKVRGTVRSEAKGKHVLSLPALKSYKEQISYVVIESLEEGEFGQALDKVDALAHVASPFHFKGKTWNEYGEPAIKGTNNVLGQAAKVQSIKAVAVVSSLAAVAECCDPFTDHIGRVYTEDDWLPQGKKEAEEKVDNGDHSAQALWYCVSKKETELAAMAIHDKYQPSWTLGFVNPPSIFGPPIHIVPGSGKDLLDADTSTARTFTVLAGGSDAQIPHTAFPVWADVNAVAQGLYEIITRRKSGRYIICNGTYDFEILNRIGQRIRPDLVRAGVVPKGQMEGDTPISGGCYSLDSTKSQQELGIRYANLEDVTKAMYEQYERAGVVSV